jgi:transposase
VLGAVSREYGLEHLMVFDFSVNTLKFKIFLDELRSKYPFDDIALMMDNLRVHTSKITKERMDELGFEYCYTPPYSPCYNGIEEVWSMAKRFIKERRFNQYVNGERIDLK